MSNLRELHSHAELQQYLKEQKKLYLLLYKSGSESSECALKNVREAAVNNPDAAVFFADVNKVRDIHPEYKINTVPNLLEFENGTLKNLIRGCNENAYYKNMFKQLFSPKTPESAGKAKRVTVYSTPSCPWCTTLKNYLRERQIPFRDVDVSRDMQAAQELVMRSGQRGVPQTDIDGHIVVGFDKTKINHLLGIQG
jgi:glutaredoxin-like YruB-family protein